MRKIIVFKICLFTFLVGVSNGNLLFAQDTSNTITIIFNQTPKYPKKIEVAKNIFVENNDAVILIYDNFHANFFEPDSSKSSDTLKIVPSSDYIFIKHSFNTISFFYYLFKKGDFVVFSYENGVPVANVLNRPAKKYDINFELNVRGKVSTEYPHTPYEVYLNPFFADTKTEQDNIVNLFHKVKKKEYYAAKKCFFKEQKFLDSIRNKGEISEVYYLFFSDKCRYLTAMMDVEQGNITAIDSLVKKKPSGNLPLPYSFYYNFISSFVQSKIEKTTNTLFSSNGQIADYRKVFDSIERNPLISPPYKDLLLHKYLILIANNFKTTDFETYFSKFQNISKDSFLIEDIRSRYFANFSTFKYALNTLYIATEKKTVLNFADILRKNKGKIIYIDFWASWCIPCRAVMKESTLLRNEFKNILFLYLSIDNDFDLWNKAIRNEGLAGYENSYLILNNQSNRFLREIKLASIPRYLLFDKGGKLIYQNAPGPESKEIRKLLGK